jgi:copper transport protein
VSGQTIIGGHEQVLALRGCGTGCFLASVKWAAGDNQVQLAIGTPGWDGGDALLDIPWPPRTDPALLPAVLAAMNAVPELTLHEAVTSDYAGYPGDDHPLVLPGAQFIATEPYNSGGGSPVVLSTNEADTVLGLSFADGQTVQLVVSNDDHRILHEEYVSPNHLITRTFEYPGSP